VRPSSATSPRAQSSPTRSVATSSFSKAPAPPSRLSRPTRPCSWWALRRAPADLVVGPGAEAAAAARAIEAAIAEARPALRVCACVFRPRPIEPVAGRRVFFATTAPAALLPSLTAHLERAHGCTVVGSSPHLSDRTRLRADLDAAAGTFDLLLTELKAAAVDVVAEAGDAAGVPVVLCDNVPEGAGCDLDAALIDVAALAAGRGGARR
jgi:cyclic 2,3-diphosphoglycerate synthetase